MKPNLKISLGVVVVLAYLGLIYGLKPKTIPAALTPTDSNKQVIAKLTEISKQLKLTNTKLGANKPTVGTKTVVKLRQPTVITLSKPISKQSHLQHILHKMFHLGGS